MGPVTGAAPEQPVLALTPHPLQRCGAGPTLTFTPAHWAAFTTAVSAHALNTHTLDS